MDEIRLWRWEYTDVVTGKRRITRWHMTDEDAATYYAKHPGSQPVKIESTLEVRHPIGSLGIIQRPPPKP